VDLNLLVTLDALLTEMHVTRAAERVGLSQPAMSNALGRLRHVFKDELLVRTSSGMQATPRALELTEPIRRVLRSVERVFDTEGGFDPARSSRTFTVRMSDVVGQMLLPPLYAVIDDAAPSVRLDIIHLSPHRTTEALEKDEIDIAVSMGLVHPASIQASTLMTDHMVCVMRTGHALAREELTLERFLAQRHLKVSMSPTDMRFVDDVLAKEGHSRRLALNVPHWMLVPRVLCQSNMLAVMPKLFAQTTVGQGLVVRDLPLPSQPFEWSAYWHRRHKGDQGIAWLVDRLRDAASRVQANVT
jgi:DNA-binding transcriptional LysR family regulator